LELSSSKANKELTTRRLFIIAAVVDLEIVIAAIKNTTRPGASTAWIRTRRCKQASDALEDLAP
jgi:hypothetical protein